MFSFSHFKVKTEKIRRGREKRLRQGGRKERKRKRKEKKDLKGEKPKFKEANASNSIPI